MTTLYGISNCDTCRKARRFLDGAGIAYRFHDLRQDGLDGQQVQHWLIAVGVETLINRRSTTWRSLNEAQRARATPERAAGLLLEHPTLVKRPVLDTGEAVHVGFREADYRKLLGLEQA